MTNTPAEAPATDRSPANGFFRPPPHLTPDLGRRFQADYYARIRPGLRLVSLLLAGVAATHTLVQSGGPRFTDLAVAVPALLFWLCVFGLTWGRGFGRAWQPILVLLGWATAAFMLGEFGPHPQWPSHWRWPAASTGLRGKPAATAVLRPNEVFLRTSDVGPDGHLVYAAAAVPVGGAAPGRRVHDRPVELWHQPAA